VGVAQLVQDGPARAAGERQVTDRDVERTGRRGGTGGVVARLVVGLLRHRHLLAVERAFED
jgi:hypothetical protein